MPETKNLVDEIKQVIDITSRVDERVKIIAESQQQINIRLNHFIDEHNSLTARVHVLESKNGHKLQEAIDTQDDKLRGLASRIEIVEMVGSPKQQSFISDTINSISEVKNRIKGLEDHKQGIMDRLQAVMGYIWQGIFIISICYLLYRLGLSTPPVP